MRFDISSNNKVSEDILDIQFEQRKSPQEPEYKYGYTERLNNYRNIIDNINGEKWKRVRWYINEYDFLVKDPIINRAFYKYWEMINEFSIFETYKECDKIMHCAEAPGGFIQGSNFYLQKLKPNNTNQTIKQDGWTTIVKKKRQNPIMYSISLNKDLQAYKSYNLPSYNKTILNKNIHITYGVDNTGDINNWSNINYIQSLNPEKFFLITGDGGFDEGIDFNNKEQLHYGLILSEIYAALTLQKIGGHFILKMFDIFTESSVHLLYLLSLCYSDVTIYKPKTSRPTNSEKYIICKNFTLEEDGKKIIIEHLTRLSQEIQNNNNTIDKTKFISFRIFKEIPSLFINKITNMNISLITNQCTFLESALNLCNNENFLNHYEKTLQESIEKRRESFIKWQKMYNLKLN